MEVLLVYEDCRREVTLAENSVKCIEAEFKKINPNIHLEGEGTHVLQRFSQKWNAYIDVSEGSQVAKGDKLTVVKKPPKNVSLLTLSVLCRVIELGRRRPVPFYLQKGTGQVPRRDLCPVPRFWLRIIVC